MQTPDTLEGQITEQIMSEWRAANPEANSATYNRTWSETLKTVTAKLAADRIRETAGRPSPPTYGVNKAGVVIAVPSLLETLAFSPR